MRKHLLIADGDCEASQALAAQLLLHDGITSQIAVTGRQALQEIGDENFSAAVVGIELPEMDGRELCRTLRRKGFTSPIVVVVSAASDADQILALEAGANDVISKPFNFGIFLARLRAHLRQHELTEDAILQIGTFTFWPAAKLLFDLAGKPIRLTEKEARLLKYLYRRRGEPASQERLLKEVWGYNSRIETHTVETHVFRLRRKVGQRKAGPPLIITDKDGYRLAG